MKNDDPQTYAVIGAAMEVHRELGGGFLEAVYQEAMEIEMLDRGIPYVREPRLRIHYKQRILKKEYQADFLVYDAVVTEFKAQAQLTGIDQAQVINYLKATGYRRALLFNFAGPKLEYHRLVYDS